MQDDFPLKTLCTKYDHGGGVACGDSFLVYSRAPIPQTFITNPYSEHLKSKLLEAAFAVRTVICVYSRWDDLGRQGLRSLPAFGNETSHDIDQKPWFLFNAAQMNPHRVAIVGSLDGSNEAFLGVLLAILSRPW